MFAHFFCENLCPKKCLRKCPPPPNKFSPVKFVKIEKISHFCEREKSIFTLAQASTTPVGH